MGQAKPYNVDNFFASLKFCVLSAQIVVATRQINSTAANGCHLPFLSLVVSGTHILNFLYLSSYPLDDDNS